MRGRRAALLAWLAAASVSGGGSTGSGEPAVAAATNAADEAFADSTAGGPTSSADAVAAALRQRKSTGTEKRRKPARTQTAADEAAFLGRWAYQHNDDAAAEVYFRESLELDPAHVEGHLGLGNLLHYRRKEYEEAEPHYQEVVSRDPTNFEAHIALGMLAVSSRDYDGAALHLREAVTRGAKEDQGPMLLKARYSLAYSLALQHRYDEAEQEFRVAIELDLDPSSEDRKKAVQFFRRRKPTAAASWSGFALAATVIACLVGLAFMRRKKKQADTEAELDSWVPNELAPPPRRVTKKKAEPRAARRRKTRARGGPRPAATAVEPASLASEAEPPSDADEDRSSDADEDRPSDADEDRPSDAAAPPPETYEPPSVAAAPPSDTIEPPSVAAAPPSDTIEPPSVAAAATPRPLAPAEDHDEAKATSSSSIERDESKADEKKEEEDTTRGGGATETTRGGAASRTPRGGGATETTRGGAATETPRGTESPRGGTVSEPMRAETDTTRGGVVTETRGAAESKEEEPRRASVGDAQVAALLGRLGLAALAQRFADELIDAATLRLLTVEDLECMRIPPAAAQAIVREVAAAGSKKLVIDEVLDNAEEHQAKIQSELDEHRAELARLKHVLARSIPETLVCPISRDAGVLITGRGDAAAPTWIFRGDESRRRRGSDVDILRRRIATTLRLRVWIFCGAARSDAAATTGIFRGAARGDAAATSGYSAEPLAATPRLRRGYFAGSRDS